MTMPAALSLSNAEILMSCWRSGYPLAAELEPKINAVDLAKHLCLVLILKSRHLLSSDALSNQ
jgi:hypothetical protein